MKSATPKNSMKRGGKGAIPRPLIDVTPDPLGAMAVHGGVLKGKGKGKK